MSGHASAPLVSVIAISYNHERFVRSCLDSIAAQTYPNVEVILLDDHSADGSPDMMSAWADETSTVVELIVHDENRGICRSRNECLALAHGEYVACISTDDQWLPGKLETQVDQMERLSHETAVVYSDAYLMDERGAPLGQMFIEWNRPFDRPPEGDIFGALLVGNFMPSLATLLRRRALVEIGGYDESLVYEDWDMWLRLSRQYQFAFTPLPVARYRIVENSMIATLQDDRRVEFFDSSVRLISKHLDAGEEARGLIRHRMGEFAHALELLDHPSYVRLLERLDDFGDRLGTERVSPAPTRPPGAAN